MTRQQEKPITRDQLSDAEAYNQAFACITKCFRGLVDAGYAKEEAAITFADFTLSVAVICGGEEGAKAIIERMRDDIGKVKGWSRDGKLPFGIYQH
jgi:hypothetical protein